MFFKENPFFLLGAHSRDSVETIHALAQEKQNTASTEEERYRYEVAEASLLHGSSRLRAELFWLCGMEKEDAYRFISGMAERGAYERLPMSARLLLAIDRLAGGEENVLECMEAIESLYPPFEIEMVLEEIEKDRKIAGVPSVTSVFPVEIWRKELLWEIGAAAEQVDIELYGECLTALGGKKRNSGMATIQFLSVYEEKTRKEMDLLSKELSYGLLLCEKYPAQGTAIVEEKMKAYGKLAAPFYAAADRGELPDRVEILFEKYIYTAFLIYRMGKKEIALSLLGYFAKYIRKGDRYLEKVEAWKTIMENGGALKFPYPKPVMEEFPDVPKSIGKIPLIEMPKQSGRQGDFLILALMAAGLCVYFL